MSITTAKVKEEIYRVIPPTLFFFLALHIVAIIRVLMNKGTGISLTTTASLAVAALILGKAVLIAEMLPFVNRYLHQPLIYNVAWKSILYLIVAFFIHYIERLIDFSRRAGGVIAGNEKLLTEIMWPQFLAIQIMLFYLIVMYCIIDQLIRVIGADDARKRFFGPLRTP